MKTSLENIRSLAAQAQGAVANLSHLDGSVRESAVAMVRDVIGRIGAEADSGIYNGKK